MKKNKKWVIDGNYISNKLNSYCLEIQWGNKDEGTKVVGWVKNILNLDCQHWVLEYV